MSRTLARPAWSRSLTVVAVLAGLLVLVPPAPAHAAPVTTALTVTLPATGVVDTEVTARAVLTRGDTSAPVAGVPVRLERRVGGAWQPLLTGTTDVDGAVAGTLRVAPRAADNAVRAVFDGTAELAAATSEPGTVTPVKRATSLALTGPARIVDETAVTLRLRWRAANGDPVPGAAVVQVRTGSGAWKRHARVTLGADGVASLTVRPRVDSRWRAVGAEGRWWQAATSAVHVLDNVPPRSPVDYPAAAPDPRVTLPRQQRAVGAGPNATVSRVSTKVWRSMVGRSWHRGCPVGRSQLRVVRVNYWGYDGYRYRGELVVNAAIAGKTRNLFSALHRQGLPVRAMWRVDRFGWSKRLGGADDYRSMAAGNTSAFNCRNVVGRPGVRSPHSYGRALDINPWENPYRASHGWVPNSWWVSRSHPVIAWRSSSHAMVRTMRAHGFRWTYGTGDAHHFDG